MSSIAQVFVAVESKCKKFISLFQQENVKVIKQKFGALYIYNYHIREFLLADFKSLKRASFIISNTAYMLSDSGSTLTSHIVGIKGRNNLVI